MDGERTVSWLVRICYRPVLQRLVNRLAPLAGKRWFPALAGLLAFGATLSMSVPTVPVLSALVLLERRRWLAMSVWAVAGSAAAGALLVHVLRHFATLFVAEKLPELAASSHWQHLTDWVSLHGWWTLAVVAASPVSQTPVLILAAVLGMSTPTVFFSLAAGKAVKYGFAAGFTAKAAERLAERRAVAEI